ncbi:MAG: PD-(D/E)XK nuclease family protein [Candidatus Methanofastidiosa archaeon]|nr:PD-(D/E)XK nuclease family protein [Candidatus Methanofastidiosa archaeon]
MKDKYSAVWVSHSSISDFLKCPRSYYLRNVYKNPKTGRKMTVMTPPLALGQAVHEVIESLATLPSEERLSISLIKKLDPVWLKVTGKKGGFKNYEIETVYRDRARQMLINLQENPGPIVKKAIKIKSEMGLPHFWLDEGEGIILCGKIDWLSYDEVNDSVHIIDFKTGKNEESEDSLQLPIYLLIAKNTQSKEISGASYWYLDRDDGIVEKKLPDVAESFEKVFEIAKEIKEARQKNIFECPKGGCHACRPYERILNGEGELVGVSETRQDIYILPD